MTLSAIEKRCNDCMGVKPLSLFCRRSDSKDGTHSYCKMCMAARMRDYYKRNPDKCKRAARSYEERNIDAVRETRRKYNSRIGNRRLKDWRKRNPEGYRAQKLRNNYGMKVEDYDALLKSQAGVCASCGMPESKIHANGSLCRLSVDHDHSTGAVRGLLCSGCNLALGNLREDVKRILGLAEYIGRWK